MRRLLTAAALAVTLTAPAFAAPIDAPSGRYEADPSHTSVTWRVKHLGLSNYTARFAKIASTVQLDAANPANSKLSVTIDANSVRTDFPFTDKVDFDKELGGGDKWMNGAKFPQITFVSTGIAVTGPKTAKITGDLTLRGVTKPVVLDAVFNGTTKPNPLMGAERIGVSAHTSIKRSAWGMDYGVQFVGDDVDIAIEAEYKLVK